MGSASMELTIMAASLAVSDDVKESDRREIEQTMRTEVLEVDKHPEITFKSGDVTGAAPGPGSFRVVIEGTLTLRGLSHPQQIEAQVNITGDRLSANGQCRVRQSDYGIKPVSVVGGTIKLKDEIDLSFDIGRRSSSSAPPRRLTTIEFEPGAVADLNRVWEQLAPKEGTYRASPALG